MTTPSPMGSSAYHTGKGAYPRSPLSLARIFLKLVGICYCLLGRYENAPDGVDIEISSATLPEFRLHVNVLRCSVINFVEPARVNGASSSSKDPVNSDGSEALFKALVWALI